MFIPAEAMPCNRCNGRQTVIARLTGNLKLSGTIYSIAVSPDGNTLASGGQDKTVKLWDAQSGQERATLTGHTSGIYCVVFSPDGKTLYSTDWYGNVLIHTLEGL